MFGRPSTQCSLGAVQFATEVDPVGAVHLLEEDDRDSRGASGRDQALRVCDPAVVTGHVLDAHQLGRHVTGLLHVDDDQDGITYDERLFRHLTSCDCDTWIGGGPQQVHHRVG